QLPRAADEVGMVCERQLGNSVQAAVPGVEGGTAAFQPLEARVFGAVENSRRVVGGIETRGVVAPFGEQRLSRHRERGSCALRLGVGQERTVQLDRQSS